jgi:hypothetical protein
MKYPVLLVTILFSLSLTKGARAFAAVSPEELFQPGVSHYDALVSYFSSGTVPVPAELAGIWSGRCYEKGSSKPAGFMLAAKNVSYIPGGVVDNGPLFPPPAPVRTFNVALINHLGWGEAAGRYDNPSQSDLNDLSAYLQQNDFVTGLGSEVSEGSLVAKNAPGKNQFVVRKWDQYFLVESVATADVHGGGKRGEILGACYFFKKIAP